MVSTLSRTRGPLLILTGFAGALLCIHLETQRVLMLYGSAGLVVIGIALATVRTLRVRAPQTASLQTERSSPLPWPVMAIATLTVPSWALTVVLTKGPASPLHIAGPAAPAWAPIVGLGWFFLALVLAFGAVGRRLHWLGRGWGTGLVWSILRLQAAMAIVVLELTVVLVVCYFPWRGWGFVGLVLSPLMAAYFGFQLAPMIIYLWVVVWVLLGANTGSAPASSFKSLLLRGAGVLIVTTLLGWLLPWCWPESSDLTVLGAPDLRPQLTLASEWRGPVSLVTIAAALVMMVLGLLPNSRV